MAFGALGIVFGDIGTSPLYALNEASQARGLPSGEVTTLGIMSLIFWTLNLIVSVKYLLFITLVENDGEGGVFALAEVLKRHVSKEGIGAALVSALVIGSTALLFADSLITPPLSIMAAMEGMRDISPDASELVIPLSLAVLLGLFAMQRFGSQALSGLFSPVMLLWFSVIGIYGLLQVLERPDVLRAMSPHYAIHLVSVLEWRDVFPLFGAILLAATGAEAIYADMGHFGRKPISLAWFGVAMAALLLSYFGQTAWILSGRSFQNIEASSFFAIVPQALLVPTVVLAALASVIAGQAVISGMFSMVTQATRTGYLPRFRVIQTSESVRGQIYVPTINTLLMAGGVALILFFESSSALAGSYGFAVAAAMLLTTLAFNAIILLVWRWTIWKIVIFVFLALPLDILFFAATVFKLPAGRFVTLAITLAAAGLMASWYYGNRRLMQRAQRIDIPLEDFVELVSLRSDLHHQPKPAIFFQHLPFDPSVRITPFALLQQVQVTSMLFQPTVVVNFITAPTPRVAEHQRVAVHECGHGVTVVHLTFGYWEQLSVNPVIRLGMERGWWAREEEVVYFSVRENLRHGSAPGFPLPMKWMLRFLHQFDQQLIRTLGLDPARCVELGVTVEI